MRITGIISLIAVMLTSIVGVFVTARAWGAQKNDIEIGKYALGASDLAVIINDADPMSVHIGQYYKKRRHIPEGNIIHVRFKSGSSSMSRAEFQRVKAQVDRATPSHVQVYALAWTQPYRVECMSITTAFAAGFDKAFCAKGCEPTKPNPYFDSNSRRPYDNYGLRPAMMLAGSDFQEVKKLIDRGIASDHTFPRGTGYLVRTSDKARNTRSVFYPEIIEHYMGSPFDIRLVKANFIQNRKNVLFYFTGITWVKALDSIRFVPGAIADHLTSAGGVLFGKDQMSILRWLDAGATGSYGTVREPCNYMEKFPNPVVVINRYLDGDTLIEAYWKSVAWPGQGLFVGEPLADPFGRYRKYARTLLRPGEGFHSLQ